MKKLVIFVVMMVGALAIIPWIDGVITKRFYLNLLTSLNQTNQVKLEVVEYHNGWLKSHVKIRYLNIIPPSQAQQYMVGGNNMVPNEITLDEVITHGPFVNNPTTNSMTWALASINTTLHLPNAMESKLLPGKASEGLLQVSSIITFDHEWMGVIKSPSLHIKLPKNTELTWQGIQGMAQFKLSETSITKSNVELTLGDLTVDENSASNAPTHRKLSLQAITIKYNGELKSSGLWEGAFDVTLPSLAVAGPDGNNVNINGLTFKADAGTNANNHYKIAEVFSLTKAELPGNPTFVISPAKAELAINDLSIKGLVSLIRFIKTITNDKTTLSPAQLQAQYLNLLVGVITPSTTVDSNVSISTSLGKLSLVGKAALPPNSTSPNSLNEALVVGNAHIDIHVSAPLAMKIVESVYNNIPETNQQTELQSVTHEEKDIFNQNIASMMQAGQLDLSSAVYIMDLHNKQVTAEEFSNEITKMGLSATLISELNQLYLSTTKQTQEAKQTLSAPPAERAKQTIDLWIQEGFLIPEADGYKTSITQEAGSIKVNGRPLNVNQDSLAIPQQPLISPTPQVTTQ